jgi:hypothetical protein
MLRGLIQRLNYVVNRFQQSSASVIFGLSIFYVIPNHFVGLDCAKSASGLVKSLPLTLRNGILDFGNSSREYIQLGPKISELIGIAVSSRPKAAHEFLEISDAALARASIIALGLQNMESVTHRAAQNGRNHQTCVFSVWHVVWPCMSGVAG